MKIEDLRGEISVKEYVANYVDLAITSERCAVCESRGATWACPPFDFDPMEVWNSYEHMLVVGKKMLLEEGDGDQLIPLFQQTKHILNEELLALEKEYPGSRSLSAGKCSLCDPCLRGKGLPCCHPDKMRNSIESLGGLVDPTTKDILNTELLWGKDGQLPEYFMLVGALLY